jgi:hypothetical protein
LSRRVDPAGLDAHVETPRHLVVDGSAEPGQAAEGRLDVPAGAPETVIEIEMAEGGIEVVDPHQANHAAAEPDAFGISGRPVDGLGGFNEFIGLALVFLGRIGRLGRICRARLIRLILGVRFAALGKGASDTDQEGDPRDGEVPQDRNLKLTHPSTHKFPDLLPARGGFSALV